MQVRCPLCWEMYNDRDLHKCSPDPRQPPDGPTCSPVPPRASSAMNRLTLNLYTTDAIKLRDCLRHVGKLAILIGMPSSVFFDTLLGVETSLTNALVQSGTPQSIESLRKKSTPISPQQPVLTTGALTRAAASAVFLLTVLQPPYSLDELASRLHRLFGRQLTVRECWEIGQMVLDMTQAEGVSQLKAIPSDQTD